MPVRSWCVQCRCFATTSSSTSSSATESILPTMSRGPTSTPIADAQAVIDRLPSPPRLTLGSASASYSPLLDRVRCPFFALMASSGAGGVALVS